MSLLTHVRALLARPAVAHEQAAASVIAKLQGESNQRTFKLSHGPLDQFAWPDESTLDDWGKLRTRKLRGEIEERYTRYRSFDICCLRDYVKEMRIPLTPSTKHSFDCLQELHCVNFEKVPQSIFERIPHWFNHVISCGQIYHPLIADSALDSVIDV